MKAFQAFFALGGILLIIAVYLLFPVIPTTGTDSFSLTPGGNMYYYVTFNVYKGGRISGQFTESSGHPVTVYVFDSGQYTAFKAQGSAQSLYSSSSTASGSYSAAISLPGAYYLVFMHGTGFATVSQNVSFNYTIDGYNSLFLLSGLASLFGGLALFAAGFSSKRKYQAKVLAPTARDVIVFDRPSPPSQG